MVIFTCYYVDERHIDMRHIDERPTEHRINNIESKKMRGETWMEQSLKQYSPMTETTYYTLLSLNEPRHGYLIMQYVSELTEGRIRLGTGTLYTMLGRLVEDNLISIISNENGKKTYQITEQGRELMRVEIERIRKQLENGERIYGEG